MPPKVSVIIPCYNEVRTIGALLEAIRGQSYPVAEMQVVVADGGSTDGTRDVIQAYSRDHPEVDLQLVDNPSRIIPAALNKAISQASGGIVVRLDAHSVPHIDYISRCVDTLSRTGAANVGGIWEIRPGDESWIAHSIAAAAGHPLGAGDARYRVSGSEGPADTVPFGAYPREWLARVGQFNEGLLTNEDYEFNVRIRALGGTVWFDPQIRSVYYARHDLPGLARQYARYGFWKARMLLRHPRSLRWRQALPPLFVLSLLAFGAAAPVSDFGRLALAVEWIAYAMVTLLSGFAQALRRRAPWMILSFPLALATMHISWGGAFWWGLLTGVFGGRRGRA